jgi:hypothetical protein
MWQIVVTTYDDFGHIVCAIVVEKDKMPTVEEVQDVVLLVQSDATQFIATIHNVQTGEGYALALAE